MDPQTVNLTLSTSGVVPVSVSAYNANTLILSCDGDLSGGTFEELTAEIYQNANLGEGPLATVTYAGALGAGPHLLTFVPEQTNLLPSAPSILSRGFYLVVRGTGTGGIKTVFALGRLTLHANPASDIGAPPPAPSLYASNVFRYVAAVGSTSITASGRDDTLTVSATGAGSVSLNPTTKTITLRMYGGAAWSAGIDYAVGAVVSRGTSVYVSTLAHTSGSTTEPGVGASWATAWSVVSGAQADWAASSGPSAILNKPTLGDSASRNVGTSAGTVAAGDHTHTTSQVSGLDTALAGKAATSHTHTTSQISGLDTALGLKADLVGGKLSTSQLPDLAIVQYLGAAANQAAMLALVGQRGDWCTRTDEGKTYILTAEPSSTLANWTAMSYPASPVVSVAGRTGAITLSSGDISGLGALATLSAVGTAQITDGTVTLAKLANVATGTVFYRRTSGTGAPEVQTLAQLKTDLALAAADIAGLGALATLGAVGSAQITDGAVTNAQLANMAAATVKGSIAGGVPADLNQAQLTSLISTFTTSLSGAVPAASGGNLTTEFLRKDGTWATPPGGGTGTAAGTGAELQFRNSTTGAFNAVTNSSVSGGTITLGDAENYGATPLALLALRNTTAATDPGVAQVTTGQQSSPAFQLEGQGWNYTGGVAASTPVRVRGYVQPQTPFGLNNATNVLFRLESQIASGAWSRMIEFRQSPAQGFMASVGPAGGITLGGSNGNDGVFTGSVSAGVELIAIVSSAASAGTQRNSGIIRQEGQGWNGTASVPVEFRSYVRPTAATPNPIYDYIVEARHNRGSWTQLMRIQTGENGNLLTTGSVSASFGGTYVSALDVAGQLRAGGTFAGTRIRSGDTHQWTSSPSDPNVAADLSIGRRAAANLRLGAADAASPVAQTISTQSVLAGVSGTAGANFSIDGSQGTGTGAGGDLIFRTAPALATSGTAQNPHVESLRLRAGRGITVSNSGFTTPTAQESLGEITVMNGVSVGSGAAVALSETWGVKWVTATAYALGARVYNGQASYRCILAHTSAAGTNAPGVDPSWTTNWALDTRPGMLIPPNTSGHALIIITGVSTAGDTARYMRQVSWKNVAGTASLVGAVTTVGLDVTATTGTPSITVADGATTETLEINCTGVSGQTWRWQAVIISGELAYGS